jgi:hypothetical protein
MLVILRGEARKLRAYLNRLEPLLRQTFHPLPGSKRVIEGEHLLFRTNRALVLRA